jgi:hypothetical protein
MTPGHAPLRVFRMALLFSCFFLVRAAAHHCLQRGMAAHEIARPIRSHGKRSNSRGAGFGDPLYHGYRLAEPAGLCMRPRQPLFGNLLRLASSRFLGRPPQGLCPSHFGPVVSQARLHRGHRGYRAPVGILEGACVRAPRVLTGRVEGRLGPHSLPWLILRQDREAVSMHRAVLRDEIASSAVGIAGRLAIRLAARLFDHWHSAWLRVRAKIESTS